MPTGTRAPERAPVLDPRIESRRRNVARRNARRRAVLALAAVAVLGAAAGLWALAHSRFLSARVVTVTGSVHTPVAEIERVAGLSSHPPMIDVDPGAMDARLDALPWVARASVTTHWPDGVTVSLVERRPVAVVAVTSTSPTRWAEIDRTGRVLAEVATRPPGLVLIVPPAPPGAPGSVLPALDLPALSVASTLPRAFSAQVTEVTEDGDGQVRLALSSPVSVVIGNSSHLDQKYEDVAAALAGAKLSAGDVIDVAAPGAPTIGVS